MSEEEHEMHVAATYKVQIPDCFNFAKLEESGSINQKSFRPRIQGGHCTGEHAIFDGQRCRWHHAIFPPTDNYDVVKAKFDAHFCEEEECHLWKRKVQFSRRQWNCGIVHEVPLPAGWYQSQHDKVIRDISDAWDGHRWARQSKTVHQQQPLLRGNKQELEELL